MRKSDLETLESVLKLVQSRNYIVRKIEMPVSGEYSSQSLKLDLDHVRNFDEEDLSYLGDDAPKREHESPGTRARRTLGL